ncbi:MAG: SHOCT domain-containing protein [Candidatus Cyclobacteriaceae bacterium M3_2C_046]
METIFFELMMYDGYGMHWGWWLFWLAIFVIIVWFLFMALRKNRDKEIPIQTPHSNALELLEKRYARGEIDTR